jgi:hypothetical protein
MQNTKEIRMPVQVQRALPAHLLNKVTGRREGNLQFIMGSRTLSISGMRKKRCEGT